MSVSEQAIGRPELFIGLVAPIGSDIELVERCLKNAFAQVKYECRTVSVSGSIKNICDEYSIKGESDSGFDFSRARGKIDAGNAVRAHFQDDSVLAAHAILSIREMRSEINLMRRRQEKCDDSAESLEDDANTPVRSGIVYIIRQLKRKEEAKFLRSIYGKCFIQVSVTQDRLSRIDRLSVSVGREERALNQHEVKREAEELIVRDEAEPKSHGQAIAELFQMGDVFIDAGDAAVAELMTNRFVQAFFGRNNIGPTREEFGSYMAKTASLRSVDLSRQVGAAIFSKDGDLITIGCNDVPKPGGGIYWDEDPHKARDIDRGMEANREETLKIAHAFLDMLKKNDLLKEGANPGDLLRDESVGREIKKSKLGEITEYGRMVHAEMGALTDAARLGVSVKGAVMYVTTFPCHNCAKHIIASGISEVIFIEPYPKSRTDVLYGHAVTDDHNSKDRVLFRHFTGISPERFRDIFEKGGRKDADGYVLEWYNGKCTPRISPTQSFYIPAEIFFAEKCLEMLRNIGGR